MTTSCSLADTMSEQLIKELQLGVETIPFPQVAIAKRPFITGENTDTSSDLMLAQILQMEFGKEYDAQFRQKEDSMEIKKKFPCPLKIIEKSILMKTVIALKMGLTARILMMISTD